MQIKNTNEVENSDVVVELMEECMIAKPFQERSIVETATRYFTQFPQSAVSVEHVLGALHTGRRTICWETGVLFDGKVGKPVAEDIEECEAARFAAESVAAGDLIDDGVNFGMRDEETDFLPSGELRGVWCLTREDTQWEIVEPFSDREAVEFIAGVLVPGTAHVAKHEEDATAEERAAAESKAEYIRGLCWKEAREKMQQWAENLDVQGVVSRAAKIYVMLAGTIQMLDEKQVEFVRKSVLEQKEVARQCWRRETLGEMCSYQGQWFIGARQGTTDGEEAENDRQHTKLEQYTQPGERESGELDFADGLKAAETETTVLYNFAYPVSDEDKEEEWYAEYVKNGCKFSQYLVPASFPRMYAGEKRVRKADGTRVVETTLAADGGWANSGWSERNVYLASQARRRSDYFEEKAWRLLTWPLCKVETGLAKLDAEYRADSRAYSPGGRSVQTDKLTDKDRLLMKRLGIKVGHKWNKLPLVGRAAINALRQRGLAGLAGRKAKKDVTFTPGEAWHKARLKKEHIIALREITAYRLNPTQVVSTGFGLNLVKQEQRVNTWAGLPGAYISEEYGRRNTDAELPTYNRAPGGVSCSDYTNRLPHRAMWMRDFSESWNSVYPADEVETPVRVRAEHKSKGERQVLGITCPVDAMSRKVHLRGTWQMAEAMAAAKRMEELGI